MSSISDSSSELESYDYLGYAMVVERSIGAGTLTWSLIGSSTGDAGDQYTGLDRFGRLAEIRYENGTDTIVHLEYGYNRNSQRIYKEDKLDATKGEIYNYNNLGELTSYWIGELNQDKTGFVSFTEDGQEWALDSLGNWTELVNQPNGGGVSREHNSQNQITDIGGTSLTYDANGNLTGDHNGKEYIYDAWNRLVRVEYDNATLVQYEYDGLFRRVQETRDSETLLLTYSADWQILEELTNGSLTTRYVYSPVYVDALLFRDRDVDANGNLKERIFALQDANYIILALTDLTGTIIDRMEYKPFGEVSILNDNVEWKHYYQGGF